MAFPTREWLTKAGALDLAQIIEGYWAAKGKRVRTRVEECGKEGGKSIYSIRSDMIAGSPRP
jgi:hypothetical protein